MGWVCSTRGKNETRSKFLSGNLKGRDHSDDRGVDTTMLNWIFSKQGGKVWTGPVMGCYERGNEHSGSVKGGEFLD
jgi:hypothetical protein